MCICVWVYAHEYVGFPQLEFQALVSCLILVVAIKLGSLNSSVSYC